MSSLLLTLPLAFACGVIFWIGVEKAGHLFDSRNRIGAMAYTLWILLLFAFSLLAVTGVGVALGTYDPPQTRRLMLGAYGAACCLIGLVFRVRERIRR